MNTMHDLETLKQQYLDSLTPKEKKAYLIAQDHLGNSFTLEKSIGFIKWRSQLEK
jgi:hypothetical protein